MIHPVETTEVTATGTATTGNGKLMGGILTAGSGAAATVTLYDNTAASGTVLRAVNAPAGEGPRAWTWRPGGIRFGVGLHAVLTGAGAKLYLDF